MAFQIIRNDIVKVEADAIVNTANPQVDVGAGVDESIYRAAGWDRLLADREKIGVMEPGDVAHTPAYDLDAKYIIHTIGPAWRGGDFGERETVARCYRKSLELADELGCESIAFPLIATGTYGFPKDEALRIAVAEISSFLLVHEMEVMLVVYDRESFEVSGKLFDDIKAYVEEDEVECVHRRRRRFFSNERWPESQNVLSIMDETGADPTTPEDDESVTMKVDTDCFASALKLNKPLSERLSHLDKTFQEHLFMLIDRKGLKDSDVYKKANIDRKHFSKIRSNVDYNPSKKTALALAIALELNIDQTRDLLMRAGLALSGSSPFDRIIEYCIETGEYDIYEINCILFDYDQPLLGA